MLKTVGKYETDTEVFVFKVRKRRKLATVNIIDTGCNNSTEEFSLIPIEESEDEEEQIGRKTFKENETQSELEDEDPENKNCQKEREVCEVCKRSVRKILQHSHVCNLKLYGCSCGAAFALKREIDAHVKQFKIIPESHAYQCRRCPILLTDADEFSDHLNNVHDILLCLLCYKHCSTKESLKNHLDTHANREVFTCNVCSLELSSQDGVNCHMQNIHLGKEDPVDFTSDLRSFKCAFCPEAFKLPRELRRHNAVHKELMLKCPSCESFHLNQQELYFHLKRHPSHRKSSFLIK
ncbi:hypothetical protein DMENIID0001_133860 [Sergentomyia squamirostris]